MSAFEAKVRSNIGLAFVRIIPLSLPSILKGVGCLSQIVEVTKKLKLSKLLIVTDSVLSSIGLLNSTLETLNISGVKYILFDKVEPDPTAELGVEGAKLFLSEKCDGILAFGGGSSIDCAKIIQVFSTDIKRAETHAKSFMGFLGVSLFVNLPPVIAVPTTAGTGSETTQFAVVSFPKEKRKYIIVEPRIIPKFALLDPVITKDMPRSITASTGMDALTHAIESYLSPWKNNETSKLSLSAIEKIFKYLPICFNKPGNLSEKEYINAREKVLLGSFEAGLATNRAAVGYVHAIAHQLGALLHTPHGEANSIFLHAVLSFYLAPPTNKSILNAFCEMGQATGLIVSPKEAGTDSVDQCLELSSLFLKSVRNFCGEMEVPAYVKGFSTDLIKEVAQRAINEAHGRGGFTFYESPIKFLTEPGYPVAKHMTIEQCVQIISPFVDPSLSHRSNL